MLLQPSIPKGMLHRHSSTPAVATTAVATTAVAATSSSSTSSSSSSTSSSSTTTSTATNNANGSCTVVVTATTTVSMMSTVKQLLLPLPQSQQQQQQPVQNHRQHVMSYSGHHPLRHWMTLSHRSHSNSNSSHDYSLVLCVPRRTLSRSSKRIMIPVCFGVVMLCVSLVQFYVSTVSMNTTTTHISSSFQQPLLLQQQQHHHHHHQTLSHNNQNPKVERTTVSSKVLKKRRPLTSDETSIGIPTANILSNHINPAPTIAAVSEFVNTKSSIQPRVVHLLPLSQQQQQQYDVMDGMSTRLRLQQHQQQHRNSSIQIPKPMFLYHNKEVDNDDDDDETDLYHTNETATVAATTVGETVVDRFNHIKAMAMQQYMTECVPMVSWHTQSYPTCNTFHEMDMITTPSSTSTSTTTVQTKDDKDDIPSMSTNDDISLLSDQGSWRSVWKVRRNLWWNQFYNRELRSFYATSNTRNDNTNRTTAIYNDDEEIMVLKLLKFQRRDFNEESYHHHRIDAMAMERLTRSTHIVNIYGYCSQSVLTEYASTSARSLTKNKSLSSLDRLKLGRDIVQAMTHLHSIDYDQATNITMTHNDLNMANAVAVRHQIKLNDFNIGIIQRWNTSSQRICKTPVLFEAPLWKSPEEIMASAAMKSALDNNMTLSSAITDSSSSTNSSTGTNSDTTTRIIDTSQYWVDAGPTDVFGLGNLLFQVLTKCQPWTHLEIDGPKSPLDAARRKVRGEQPYVPSKYHYNTTTKVAYAALHYAVLLCYQRLPEHRPTSYELLIKLNTVIDWIEDATKSKQIRASELKDLFLPSTKE